MKLFSILFTFAGIGLAAPGFFDGIIGMGQMDANGNSFLKINHDTEIHGMNINNMNQNRIIGQQGGPAIEGNGIAAVVAN